MAYNDDAVLARLSSLNESHDSIATAAQWIMFHRRHADRTVQLWLQRLKDSSSSKRLSLVYLANEVAQQSRIRHKEDFIIAFSPTVAEAAAIAYKGAPSDIQGKLRRVVEVWKDRAIFEVPIQKAIEGRLDELDKARGTSKPGNGGSIFGGAPNIPVDFAPLVSAYQAVGRLADSVSRNVTNSEHEYKKQTDPSTDIPSAPVYAARLNGLLKNLASAELAVAERVKARETLVSGLAKMLESNRAELERDQATVLSLLERKTEIEQKKQQVELGIMRALGPTENTSSSMEAGKATGAHEVDRPEMEALTPPAMEAFTPPDIEPDNGEAIAQDLGIQPGSLTTDVLSSTIPDDQRPWADDRLSVPSHQKFAVLANGQNKRRRLDEGDFPDLGADDDIDEDVATMLKEEEAL